MTVIIVNFYLFQKLYMTVIKVNFSLLQKLYMQQSLKTTFIYSKTAYDIH